MRRLSFVFIVLLLLSTGCRIGPAGKSAMVGAGIASTLGGVVLMSQVPVDSDGDGANENPFNDNLGAGLMGAAMVSAGLAMLIGGIAAEATEPRSLPTSAYVYAPARYTPAPVVTGPPGTVGVHGEPAGTRMPLPELAASEQVVRIAQQVRSAASRGDCSAAWSMWDQLDAVDVTYADAVRSGPILAPCPR